MTEEKIISRIRKMLALANDLAATEGERDNALRMAFATMAKYNIDMSAVEQKAESEARINFENVSWGWTWAKQVNQIIGNLFFCKYYYGRKINGTQTVHHFVGKESNAMTAAVMADYVVNSILKEARAIYKQNTAPGTRAFAIGAMHALHNRVEDIKAAEAAKTDATPGTALVLANLYLTEQAANEAFTAGVSLKKGSKGRAVTIGSAYTGGNEFGKNINLSMQVKEEARKLS